MGRRPVRLAIEVFGVNWTSRHEGIVLIGRSDTGATQFDSRSLHGSKLDMSERPSLGSIVHHVAIPGERFGLDGYPLRDG